MIKVTAKILSISAFALAIAGVITACGDGRPSEGSGSELETVTGGHTRVVWMWHQAKKKDGTYSNDTYANGNSHLLMGLDSRDGLGVRKLIDKKGNWARPIFSPDGDTVVYTDKNVTRKNGVKHFEPEIFAIPWGGPLSEARRIGKGHAVDVWEDPEDGTVYVYAIDNLRDTSHAVTGGSRLQRYRLDGKKGEFKYGREILLEEEITLDNFQLTRDGLNASGQFPWPVGGVIDLETGDWTKRAQGCWTSTAPDNSGVIWVFDGAHRNARMSGPQGIKHWKTPINSHPDFRGLEVYHPRWSNDPRILAVTGPYGSKEVGGNQISKGGNEAEIFVGRFSDDLRGVEAWAKLTDNDTGDYYPDVWVEGGEKVSLDAEKVRIEGPESRRPSAETEVVDVETVFRWDSGKGDNKIGKRRITVEPAGIARLGYHYQMLLDGGSFQVDGASVQAVEKLVAWDKSWSIAFVLEETGAPTTPAPLLNLPGSTLFRTPNGIRYGDALLPISDSGTHSYTLTIAQGKLVTAAIDGSPVKLDEFPGKVPVREGGDMSFGSSEGWPVGYRAGISNVIIAKGILEPRPLPEFGEPLPPQIRIRAKLIEKQPTPSPVERDTYTRSLVHYIYAVEEVLEGDFDDKEVAVWNWVVLDNQETIGLPDTVGETYELTIEPAEAPYHKELDGELSTQPFTDLYLDVRTPELPRP